MYAAADFFIHFALKANVQYKAIVNNYIISY